MADSTNLARLREIRNLVTWTPSEYVLYVTEQLQKGYLPIGLYQMYTQSNDELAVDEIIETIQLVCADHIPNSVRDAILSDVLEIYKIAGIETKKRIKTACEAYFSIPCLIDES